MTLTRRQIFQAFKYAIYTLLTLNIFLFFFEESAAAQLQFDGGVGLSRIIEAYASTIDTLAWVVLLLMFELETSLLEDHHFTKRVVLTLQTMRIATYVFIVYSFYGYIANLTFFDGVAPLADVSDLCTLADHWTYASGLDEFVAITSENCAAFSSATAFYQLPGMSTVVDSTDLASNKMLAWVDVINSAVWLLIVLVLEIDVRLQEHDRYLGTALKASNASKVVMYLVLLLAAIYWGLKGDFVDFWDAFLWLVAFFFIELNVDEWRRESRATPT
ncbi:MAG: hypothetical protein O2907_08455 [Proteobacteria bacterium]|nr:hypothetical protein [Pseudomonadota bacterium]MDA1064340.1 hypothetical protein [Pseudomonadota bacterium]